MAQLALSSAALPKSGQGAAEQKKGETRGAMFSSVSKAGPPCRDPGNKHRTSVFRHHPRVARVPANMDLLHRHQIIVAAMLYQKWR